MIQGKLTNLDFLAARLHGRRSQMAEGERLDTLCRVRTLPQFAAEVSAEAQTDSASKIQRQLMQDLGREVIGIAEQLSSSPAALLRWLAVRFQIENLKVILRGILTGIGPKSWQRHLLILPREFALEAEAVASPKFVDELVLLLPRGVLRKSLGAAVDRYGKESRPFFFETPLDCGYFKQLLTLTEALVGQDKELVKPLVLQEIDTYHLMLVARGRFGYGLEAKALLSMHVSGTGITRERFASMLADSDLRIVAAQALGRALDVLPRTPGEGSEAPMTLTAVDLETLAWNRFLRLAMRAFRRSHMGFAAVVAFTEMRRVEVSNLITISEGIRARIPEEQLRARLFPRHSLEAVHV